MGTAEPPTRQRSRKRHAGPGPGRPKVITQRRVNALDAGRSGADARLSGRGGDSKMQLLEHLNKYVASDPRALRATHDSWVARSTGSWRPPSGSGTPRPTSRPALRP